MNVNGNIFLTSILVGSLTFAPWGGAGFLAAAFAALAAFAFSLAALK